MSDSEAGEERERWESHVKVCRRCFISGVERVAPAVAVAGE